MRIIGCNLHARQQTLAMLDTITGEVEENILMHEDDKMREFYSRLPRPVCVGIESNGIDVLVCEAAGRARNRMPRW